jgi:hypothetical protein
MPDIHAKLCSPSGAEGWFACPGRIVMESGFPDKDSAYSGDGTARHEFCAEALNTGLSMNVFVGGQAQNGVTYKPEWADEDQDYVDTVRTLAEGGELFVERQVNFEAYTGVKGDSFGTADAIVLRPMKEAFEIGGEYENQDAFELIVVDRKTGYVEVPVERNKQLMLYALGALAEFGMAYDIARVRLVIHQRKAREWDCSIDELLQFGKEARTAAQRVQTAVEAHGKSTAETWAQWHLNQDPSEDACRYCKAMATCPSMQAKVQEVVGADFEGIAPKNPDMKPDFARPLHTQMAAVGLVEDWCKAVRAATERRLLAGQQVPGFKLVLGKAGARKWADEAAAEDMLRKQFRLPVEKAYDLSLISPTTAEKLKKAGDIGERQWKKAEALIVRSEPKPSVALATDKRDAYVPPNAADDFAPIPESQPQEAEAGLELC